MTEATRMDFQADVGRLLHIVAHSLYSEREVFLRELVSNAADACDRLRHAALLDSKLTLPEFHISLLINKKEDTLTISDRGIGMSRQELAENLGTIAHSGTRAFLNTLEKEQATDVSLIGQFGVGFYSAYMVADNVKVVSRSAYEEDAFSWESTGEGHFNLEPAHREEVGTSITLHLRSENKEFLDPERLRHVIKTYSNHVPVPIFLTVEGDKDIQHEKLNEASALWTKGKQDISEQAYTDFYRYVAHSKDEPFLTLHFRAEGTLSYTGLLFVPSSPPFDLLHPSRQSKLRLYTKRVFITEECEDLIPSYLRFMRGVVDSDDLPLNVSREMLQNNPHIAKIRSALIKRILASLSDKAEKEPDAYQTFFDAFGMVLKEGLYEPAADKDTLLSLSRFASTAQDATSLADYVARMKEGQKEIYYIAGSSKDSAKSSPQLEGFLQKGFEVLFMTDPIDDFWIPSVRTYSDHPFTSITRGDIHLEDEPPSEDTQNPLLTAFKAALGERVADVRYSSRLTSSPVCLVAKEGAMDLNLERMLKQHNKLEKTEARVLELNPQHALIRSLEEAAKKEEKVDEMAWLLLDQASLLEGELPSDTTAFTQRMNRVLEEHLAS